MKTKAIRILVLLCVLSGTAVAESKGAFFAVIVNDIDASVEWYESTLGLVAGERLGKAGHYEIVNLRKPGLFVELLQLEAANERRDRARGLFKVGFLTNDLEAFASALPDSVTAPEIITDTKNGLYLLQLEDPDGNTIQVMELRDGRTGNPAPVVYVLAGQSNMVGHGNTGDLTAEQTHNPSNVRFFRGVEEEPLASQSRFGPEVAFAAALAQAHPDREFVLVKYAIGATSLLDWAPEWDAKRAAITGNADRWPLYSQLLQVVSAVPFDNTEFGGVLWMQGERDARVPSAGQDYYRNLATLIAAFRQNFGRPDLPFILGRVNPPADRYPARDIVRDAQETAARKIPGVYLVDTDDLSKWDDDLHYDSGGQLELGRRYAAAVMAAGDAD